MLLFQTFMLKAMVIACGSSLRFKPSVTAQLALLFMVKTGAGTHWPGCPSAFPWDPGKPALHRGSVHFVPSQETAVLLKVRVCETDTFFFFPFFPFSGDFFFFLLPSPSSPHTFPGPLPRTTLVPFSPTRGTKSFFYQPTGCSGYKVKLTMRRCNSPLQAGLDESQK